MTFKNKKELIEFVKHQINIELENDKEDPLNKKRNVLYTKLDGNRSTFLLSFFNKYNIRLEKHLNDYYWIFIK